MGHKLLEALAERIKEFPIKYKTFSSYPITTERDQSDGTRSRNASEG